VPADGARPLRLPVASPPTTPTWRERSTVAAGGAVRPPGGHAIRARAAQIAAHDLAVFWTPRTAMRSPATRNVTLYAATAVLFCLFAAAAGILAGAQYIVPIAILGVLVLGFFVLNALLARRSLARHGGDPETAQEDGDDGMPAAHVIPDDERPLGDTAEAHDEISPHDLPLDSPARRAAERQAAHRDGTTRGDREGAAGGPTLEQDDLSRGASASA
jgi:hypothetical protein